MSDKVTLSQNTLENKDMISLMLQFGTFILVLVGTIVAVIAFIDL